MRDFFAAVLLMLIGAFAAVAIIAIQLDGRITSVENCMRYTQALESEFGAVGW